MAASDGHAQLDTLGDEHPEGKQELVADAHSRMSASASILMDYKPDYECPHCSKSYTAKKGLNRHLSSTASACARQRLTEEQASKIPSKPRWECSRCGKDCSTSHSVERHISNSCWRSCDECVAAGVTRCDSVTKLGPCRTCEANGRSCTKYTSPIPGTTLRPWTGRAVQPQQEAHTDEEDASASEQQPAKRKTLASPETNSDGAHKNKRKISADLQIVDHGSGRMYDPLGGQAFVPPTVKEAAVSTWLQYQSEKSASAASSQEQVQDHTPLVDQAGLIQNRRESKSPDQFIDPSHVFGRHMPSSVAFPPTQHSGRRQAPVQQQRTSLLPPFRSYKPMTHRASAVPQSSIIPDLPPFRGPLSATAGRPMQLDPVFRQLQATRQLDAAHALDMSRRFGPRNDLSLPPFSLSSSPNLNRQGMAQTQGFIDMSSFRPFETGVYGQTVPSLTLRIHSNAYDKHGQPIFSVLRIRRNEPFGPRLDAYCIKRRKDYGLDWVFVYRYQVATLDKEVQITLTWDMTPNDVVDKDYPGVAMRNMDTIYVMKAKPVISPMFSDPFNEHAAMHYPDAQLSRQEVDIISGETNLYQNPNVSRQWYQAVEQDSKNLRALHTSMKTTIIQQRQQLSTTNKENAELRSAITKLTLLSKKLRESMLDPLPDSPAQNPSPQPIQDTDTGHVTRQRPGRLPAQPAEKRVEVAEPTAFVTKCEAVRDLQSESAQQLDALHFPGLSGEFTVPGYTHQPNMNGAFNTLVNIQGHMREVADEVAGEDVEMDMEEE